MSRNFVRSAATDYINLGDVAAARYAVSSTWSQFVFFRQASSDSSSESIIIAKQTQPTDATLRIRINNGTAPQEVEIYMDNSEQITGPDVIALNTWYMIALTNDGTGDAGGLKLYLATMDGVFETDYNPATGTALEDVSATADVRIGQIESSGADWWDGDIAHVSYFNTEFSSAKILQYLFHPKRVAVAEGAGCIYYLPLGYGSPEQDLSGNQNNGTVNGTPSISAMPPTAGFTPHWHHAIEPISAAAVGSIYYNPYRHPVRNPLLRL